MTITPKKTGSRAPLSPPKEASASQAGSSLSKGAVAQIVCELNP